MVDTLDPTAVSGLNLGEMPDIGLDTDLNTDSQPFLGVIVFDQYEPNYNKDGWQWHYGVRPVDFAVKGETGCFHGKTPISTQINSKMGMTLKAFKEIRGTSKTRVGKGELAGMVAIWIRRTIVFKGNDGSERNSQLLLPVRKPTDEEAARAAGAASVAADNASRDAGVPPTPENLTDDDIAAIMGVVQGKTAAEFQLAALSAPLAPNLLNLILSGKVLDTLKAQGIAVLDAEGRVTPTPTGKKTKKKAADDDAESDSLV